MTEPTLTVLLDPLALEHRLKEARARRAAAQAGIQPRLENAMRRRSQHPASLVGPLLAGLCLGAIAAVMLGLTPTRGRVGDLIAPEAASKRLTSIVEPPAAAPNAAPRLGAPTPAAAPATSAAPTAGVPPSAGSAATVPAATPPPAARPSRGPVPAGHAVRSAEAAPPLARPPAEAVIAALLPATAPAADTAAPRAVEPVPPALAVRGRLHYPPSARDAVDTAMPLDPLRAPAADAAPTVVAVLLDDPPATAGVPPSAGSAAPVLAATPPPAASLSRGPVPADHAVRSAEAAPRPARAPDDTVIAALLLATAPAADTAAPRAVAPVPPALAVRVMLHYPPSARDAVDTAMPLDPLQVPGADAPPTVVAVLLDDPPAAAGVPPLAGSAAPVLAATPPPAASLSRGPVPADHAVRSAEATPRPARAPDDTVIAALLLATAPAADTAAPRAVAPVPPALAVRVILHYPPSARDAVDTAIAALEAAGVIETLAVPVNFEVSSTTVRFFHGPDRAAADGVASVLARGAAVGASKARDFTHFSPRPASGELEVWLAGARS